LKAQGSGSAKELYQFYCAECHGEKGNGKGINATEDLPTQPKDFTSPKNLPVFTDQQIINTITHGGPREQLSFIMPPWGNILSAEEIELLKAHLREICKCKYDPVAAAKAKAEKEKAEKEKQKQ
jgi:cytochrome c oxidase cbb3-type subunit 3